MLRVNTPLNEMLKGRFGQSWPEDHERSSAQQGLPADGLDAVAEGRQRSSGGQDGSQPWLRLEERLQSAQSSCQVLPVAPEIFRPLLTLPCIVYYLVYASSL